MAKTRVRSTSKSKGKAAGAGGNVEVSLISNDYNPRAMPATVLGQPLAYDAVGKVKVEKTATEVQIETGTELSLAHSNEIGARWNERNKRDGKIKFKCPFCRDTFQKRTQCVGHIKAAHPAQLAQAKLEKQPPVKYTPRQFTESPKRTSADFMSPRMAQFMESSKKSQAANSAMSEQSKKLAGQTLTAARLMAVSEGIAIQKMNSLDNNELKDLTRLAHFRGRSTLARECRKALKIRGLKVDF